MFDLVVYCVPESSLCVEKVFFASHFVYHWFLKLDSGVIYFWLFLGLLGLCLVFDSVFIVFSWFAECSRL